MLVFPSFDIIVNSELTPGSITTQFILSNNDNVFLCDVILDEKTELMIQNSSKKCPNVNCGVFIHKTDGCNHITCSLCHTEFCYLCNAELPKDIHGHYDVSAHFNTGVWGVGQINGCLQFEN